MKAYLKVKLAIVGLMLLIPLAGRAQTFNVLTSFGFLTNNTGVGINFQLTQGPDGMIYGTTGTGIGNDTGGSVFKINPDGSDFTVLYRFTGGIDGAQPSGLTLAGNTFYGTTANGGINGNGTIFAINADGTGFTNLYYFTNSPDGSNPIGGLTLSGNTLYGTAYHGGTNGVELGGYGILFAINTNGTDYKVLHNFNGYPIEGAYPYAALIVSGSTLYGTTYAGGARGQGTVFAINTDGTGFNTIYDFNGYPDGANPMSSLTLVSNILYGTTSGGGINNEGAVFAIGTNGMSYALLYEFSGNNGTTTDGAGPETSLTLSGNTLYGTTGGGGIYNAGTVFAVNTDGSSYTNNYSFSNSPDGAFPGAGLLLLGSTFYGTTSGGGANGNGTLFTLNTNGSDYTIIYSGFLNGYKAANPQSGVILAGGMLYGTTQYGGTHNQGTVFSINTNGTGFTVLYNFGSFPGDAEQPEDLGQLTFSGNTLYGTTPFGGTNNDGTVFAINMDGTGYTVLYNFGSNLSGDDGTIPLAGLTLSGNTLYGTTQDGGAGNSGTVFAINIDGSDYTVLHSFTGLLDNIDGQQPFGQLILSGNTLYGTTRYGGTNGASYYGGTVFAINTDGTGYNVLYNFNASPNDGQGPLAGLTLSGNTLYGTTQYGGTNGSSYSGGTIFSINTNGTDYTVLYNFTGNADGAVPSSALALSGNKLYGTAENGGANDSGTVFCINTDGTDFAVLYGFSGGTDGANPYDVPLVVGDTLYGTTTSDGASGVGTVFSSSLTAPIIANNNTYTRNGLNTWRIKISDLLTNAMDLNSNLLSLADVGASTNGAYLLISYGYVQYYNTNLVDDQFTYQVTDSSGALSTGVITLTVNNPTGGQVNSLTVTGGVASLTFAGIPSYRYQVQVSTNLVDWTTLETTNAPSNGLFQFMDSNPPQPSAFYRLMWNGN